MVVKNATSPPPPTSVLEAAAAQKALERRVLDHVVGLLDDRRLVLPTTFGPRAVTTLMRDVDRWDRGGEVKGLLVDLDRPDFELQDRLPVGKGLDVRLSRQVLLAFNQTVGHLRVASLPPLRELATGEAPRPLSAERVREAVSSLPPIKGRGGAGAGPMTLILFSGGGFTAEARDTARAFVDGPPTVLIEPNGAGGFDVTGPAGAGPLTELLDPEGDADRRRRARAALETKRVDLITGAVALDGVARETHLPVRLVEAEAKAWARDNPEGVRVKTIDGVPMLYRDASLASRSNLAGGTTLPRSSTVSDRLRKLFGGSTADERKIAYLAERRAALSRQRDLAYEELGALEGREADLRGAFKADESVVARRRITSQLVQLGKDIERRRQTTGVLNQQINVVGTHLHNLEIARQGSTAALPSSEEIAEDAAKAEEVLAELQASSELADELAGSLGTMGLSEEEATLYDQLSAEAAGANQEPARVTHGSSKGLAGERLLNAQRARDDQAPRVASDSEGDREDVSASDIAQGRDPEPARRVRSAEPEPT